MFISYSFMSSSYSRLLNSRVYRIASIGINYLILSAYSPPRNLFYYLIPRVGASSSILVIA